MSDQAVEHEQFNIGVKALIVQDGRLLLLKRRDHGVWEPPGGRINRGEDLRTALRRELTEELPQLKSCEVGDIKHALQTAFKLPNGNSLMLLFFQVEARLPKKIKSSEEHERARWVSVDDVQKLELQPHIEQALGKALGVAA